MERILLTHESTTQQPPQAANANCSPLVEYSGPCNVDCTSHSLISTLRLYSYRHQLPLLHQIGTEAARLFVQLAFEVELLLITIRHG
jgi:hypothetical protein